MSSDLRTMVDLRHSAEQRGHFSPLGRLLSMVTQHGVIVWPSERGEGVGPDLAWLDVKVPENSRIEGGDFLMVLGAWAGLPALRKNSDVPCPKCRHACDICDGSGKKVCEGIGCGGRGTVPGAGEICPAMGCSKDSGKPNPVCDKCGGSGWWVDLLTCPMCTGSGKMTCSRCRGTGKFSTGRVRGSLDPQLPRCKACDGTGRKGELVPQRLSKFTNAMLCRVLPYSRNVARSKKTRMLCYLALGPIYNFAVQDFTTSKLRTFEVSPDDKGDLLFLLVPASSRQKPQKAYLVGGVVREREGARGAA